MITKRLIVSSSFLLLPLIFNCNSSNNNDGSNTDAAGTQGDPASNSEEEELGKLSAQCESQCFSRNERWCVTNPEKNNPNAKNKEACVECIEDKNCAQNPFAAGDSCSQGKCICKNNDGCKGNLRGGVCRSNGLCGCENASDCGNGGICKSTKVCGCGDSRACVNKSAPYCDTKKGDCVVCLDASQCKDPRAPYCNSGSCWQCTPGTGNECSTNPLSFGPNCVGKGACFCDPNIAGICRGNKGGSTCDIGICECRSDGECQNGYICQGTIGPFFGGVSKYDNSVKTCQPKCTADADCKGRTTGTSICDTASGVCGSCSQRNLSHCKTGDYCFRGRCAECREGNNDLSKNGENTACLTKYKSGSFKYCDGEGQCRTCINDVHCANTKLSDMYKFCTQIGPDSFGNFADWSSPYCRECGKDEHCAAYPKNVTNKELLCYNNMCIQCYDNDDCVRLRNTNGPICQISAYASYSGAGYVERNTCGCRTDHPEDCAGSPGKTCKKQQYTEFYTCQ